MPRYGQVTVRRKPRWEKQRCPSGLEMEKSLDRAGYAGGFTLRASAAAPSPGVFGFPTTCWDTPFVGISQ